jgi:signal peptidase II
VRARRPTLLLYGTAVASYGIDRLSKIWAQAELAGRAPIELVPGVLHLNYATNTGGAFGIADSAPLVFAAATIAVSGVIVWASFRIGRMSTAIALGLILGGALGNLTDRAVRGPGLSGSVIDFIDVRVWPIFNLADSAIVVGAVVLALVGLRKEKSNEESEVD